MEKSLFAYVCAIAAIIALTACDEGRVYLSDELAALYNEVDSEIERSGIYQQEKEKRLELLKEELNANSNDERRLELTMKLISEYEAYISDSAMYYVALAMQNPIVSGDPVRTKRLLIRRADILSHAGLFNAAHSILSTIGREGLDSTLLEPYYGAYAALYQYQREYTDDTELAQENAQLRELYTDSVAAVADQRSLSYIIYSTAADARRGNPKKALAVLTGKLAEYKSGDREYAILASIMADVFKTIGDEENYRRYLALSAISDLRGVVKENMAMRALATANYEDGDLVRAKRYLKQSFADANFYAARMRNAQSSRMLPVIDEAFEARQDELRKRQRIYLWVVTALVAVLAVVVWFLTQQISRARRANMKAHQTLAELSQLSARLKDVNTELEKANSDLVGANTIKEEYAGLFMEYCSLAISNMQQYHQQLRVLALQGNIKALMKRLDSTDVVTKTLHEFYAKFDEAILNIYPSFLEKFNSLLQPDAQIELKPGEKLNTELRVFALIRIGITDPEKIAQFLRCSLSTIYTYRSKIKKRAINPSTFEKDLLET